MTAYTFSAETAASLFGWLRPSHLRRQTERPAWDRRAALLEFAAAASREADAARRAGYALDADMLNGLAGRLEWTASLPSAAEAWDRVNEGR